MSILRSGHWELLKDAERGSRGVECAKWSVALGAEWRTSILGRGARQGDGGGVAVTASWAREGVAWIQ